MYNSLEVSPPSSVPDVKMRGGDSAENGQFPDVEFVDRENAIYVSKKASSQVVQRDMTRNGLEQD